MATDKEVILNALQRERDGLHDKIMQVDRIIKRVKGFDDANNDENDSQTKLEIKPINQLSPVKKISETSDIKIQVLTVFEMVGKACKLKDLQFEYHKLTGNAFNIREVVRGLHRQRILVMMRERHNHRGVLWLKREWTRNGVLLDEFKPEGFDLLYNPAELIFE